MTDPKLPGQYKCSGHPLQILPNNSYLPRPAGPNWSSVISLQVSAQSLSTINTKTGFLEYQFQRKTIKHNATTTSHLIFCGWFSTKFNKRNWQTTNNIFDNRQNRKFLEKGQSWSKTSRRDYCAILLNNVINQKINHSGDFSSVWVRSLMRNFTAIQMAGPMGQTELSGAYSLLVSLWRRFEGVTWSLRFASPFNRLRTLIHMMCSSRPWTFS